LATLSIRSVVVGILPIGSVGIVIGAGVAILPALLESIIDFALCEVYVSTRGASHRKLAASLGARWVGNEKDRPPVALDRAVTFAPSGDVVVAALASLRKGGVVAINGIHLDRIPEFDYDRLLWGERQLRSVTSMTRSDARDFLQIASEIGLRPTVTPFSGQLLNGGRTRLEIIAYRDREPVEGVHMRIGIS